METINCSLDHRCHELAVEFDQERNNGAAGAGELVTPASAYWFNQAVGAENPHPIAGLRGLQRHPVLLLMLGSKLAIAEPRSAVSQGEDRGQQGLLRRALWSNSGIAPPKGVGTGFNQRLISAGAHRAGDGCQARSLQPFAQILPQLGQIAQIGQTLGGHEIGGQVHDEFKAQDEALLVVALQPITAVKALKQPIGVPKVSWLLVGRRGPRIIPKR